jgi:hypothetical protein
MSSYEFASNVHCGVLTQLPFEMRFAMPEPNRGRRGYSDQYVAEAKRELLQEKH